MRKGKRQRGRGEEGRRRGDDESGQNTETAMAREGARPREGDQETRERERGGDKATSEGNKRERVAALLAAAGVGVLLQR